MSSELRVTGLRQPRWGGVRAHEIGSCHFCFQASHLLVVVLDLKQVGLVIDCLECEKRRLAQGELQRNK